MIHLVLYDISSNRIRNKIAKRLIAEGFERIQLSVFVATVDPRYNAQLWHDLKAWIALEESAKLFVLKVSTEQFKKMEMLGNADCDIDFIIGSQNSIFI